MKTYFGRKITGLLHPYSSHLISHLCQMALLSCYLGGHPHFLRFTLRTIPILRQKILGFFQTHPLFQQKYSTERQQKLLFSEPIHPPSPFADVI